MLTASPRAIIAHEDLAMHGLSEEWLLPRPRAAGTGTLMA